jgi:hypothetical protein
MKNIWISLLVVLLLGTTAPLYSQVITGSIVGNVTDPSGAAVPAVKITVRNEGTGIASTTTTGTSGTYTVPDLLAGVYTVTAVKQGFKSFQTTGIQLLSSQTVRQDVVLQVGALVQTVEVSGQVQLVQTDSPTIGGTLQPLELDNLPFMTTSTDVVMNLVPGMSQAIVNGNSNPVIGGAPFIGSSNWTVNGVTTTNPGQGGGGDVVYTSTAEMVTQANLPPIGTLQEFKVDSSMNSAEYRSQTAVTMVTKQGTNKYHGQVYEYNENKALNANSFDLNKFNENEYPFNRNQFGANVGGPILHNKLFFFSNYNGTREVHPTPITANVPTAGMRQGNFSNLCRSYSSQGLCTDPDGQQLYNPLTGQPFVDNQIPQSMITPQAKVLSAYMPLPTNLTTAPGATYLPGSPNAPPDWAGAVPIAYGLNEGQTRLDANLGSKDSVVLFATVSKGAPWFFGFACCPDYGQFADHGYNWDNFSGSETHIFGPGTVNEFRLGWTVSSVRSEGQNLGFDPSDLFPQMPPNGDRGLPTMNMSDYGISVAGATITDMGHAYGLQETADIVDNLTFVRGRHTIKTGFEETGYKENDLCFYRCIAPLGSFSFSGQWTGNRGWNLPSGAYGQSPGNSYADFLLGDAVSSSYTAPPNQDMYDREWDFYGQDTFKATPHLTLSYGVRYMYQWPWSFPGNDVTYWDPATNKLVIPENSSTVTIPPGSDAAALAEYPFVTTQKIGAPLSYFHGDWNNWAPRVGFAYRPSSNNTTVIRGVLCLRCGLVWTIAKFQRYTLGTKRHLFYPVAGHSDYALPP